jgi:hypothetical protein
VRIVVAGVLLHLASWNEPKRHEYSDEWLADWINDGNYGDTIGHIDWESVNAITWRWSE